MSPYRNRQVTAKSRANRLLCLIKEYDELINLDVNESVFQHFFEKYPVFLEPTLKHCYPQMPFGAERYPDFILTNNYGYILVEIEKPSTKLFTKSGEPTASLTHAQYQIRQYLEWTTTERDYLTRRLCPDINASNVTGLIVVGKSQNLSDYGKHSLSTLNNEVRSKYEIKTFDQLSTNLQTIAKNLYIFKETFPRKTPMEKSHKNDLRGSNPEILMNVYQLFYVKAQKSYYFLIF